MGTISQNHSKLDSNTIAEAMKPLVESDPSIKIKFIIAEVQTRFNYTISYRKAWLVKQKSIAKVFDGWKESYEVLPLRAFKYCKPLVQIDGTHLYGKYKDCLLVAVAQDRNQNIVLIAFAIVEVNRSGGDRKPPRAWWMFCIRYIGSNFLREFEVLNLQKLVVNIGYSRTMEEYNVNYRRLQERGEAYVCWCDNIERPQWVLAFDEGHRWGHMTTNLAECINLVLKGARNLPILRKRAGFTFSKFETQRIEANTQRAGNIVVHWFDRRNEVFEVRGMPSGKVLVVDLARRRCDCGNFQVYVGDIYKISEIQKVYRVEFVPLGDTETWPDYPGPTMVANPALRKKSKGRPKLTR
ncbi:uncharacterized protein LOC107614662 [Arachis ipaensis]|uniref:MULE transposase domain-containing protein n=1 Tax=Arachis hypogaea TaxID=3818 RepID=A0A444XCN8_ARAHY|nr:uncharacterized protein LOC107614662 [Arachis ipaensis]RYQ87253.1 hypothetical protein Ahy_B09g094732 [Arachis hypogaea]